MRSLLDVNVLIALFDSEHVFHEQAQSWFHASVRDGWASCPITQAGFIRVISNPRYPAGITTTQAFRLLEEATTGSFHEFWPADLPMSTSSLDPTHILGPGQVTDAYLLGLAVNRSARFVTFDRRIDLSCVPQATVENMLVLVGRPGLEPGTKGL